MVIPPSITKFSPVMKSDPFDKSLGIENAWVPHWCPIGEGMVNLSGFLAIVKEGGTFSGPVQLHFEYPLGGAENGENALGRTRPNEVRLLPLRLSLSIHLP
jgi:hypothetical protein